MLPDNLMEIFFNQFVNKFSMRNLRAVNLSFILIAMSKNLQI